VVAVYFLVGDWAWSGDIPRPGTVHPCRGAQVHAVTPYSLDWARCRRGEHTETRYNDRINKLLIKPPNEQSMSRTFNYGVYGVGRIGKVHAAQQNGARYRLHRFDDLQEYKAACIANGLLDN
jgi:hypothetical protein